MPLASLVGGLIMSTLLRENVVQCMTEMNFNCWNDLCASDIFYRKVFQIYSRVERSSDYSQHEGASTCWRVKLEAEIKPEPGILEPVQKNVSSVEKGSEKKFWSGAIGFQIGFLRLIANGGCYNVVKPQSLVSVFHSEFKNSSSIQSSIQICSPPLLQAEMASMFPK